MGKKKYIKNSKGVTMSVTTDTLGLEKPLLNENYDIDVHNRNMDKIDEDLTPIDDSYIIELFQHDGDTTNPRDYYTKVEADEKFATKEEVENIDLSNLATKEEANNALNKANEAFQRGDNVKTQLVDKLISEGLDVSTNNTFEELISGITLGKKCAVGNSNNTSGTYGVKLLSSTTKGNCHLLNLPALDFEPSCIIAIAYNSYYSPPCYEYSFFTRQLGADFVGAGNMHTQRTANMSGFVCDPNDTNIRLVNPFILPTNYINTSINFTWIAIE